MISGFVWSDGCPRVELTTLRHPGSTGGLAVPDFELCCWSFQLGALHGWVGPRSAVSWRVIEADRVGPNRLRDVLFAGAGEGVDGCRFGPVVANSIGIWRAVERRMGGPFGYCGSAPLWHSLGFVCRDRPFVQPSWSSLGVGTCGDVYGGWALCSFRTLRARFCLPASTCFVFLWLRSALEACGVPWSSPVSSRPVRDWIAPSAGRPSVSLMYSGIVDCIAKPFSIGTIWSGELSDLDLSVDWERVWSGLSLASEGLAHRLVHFGVIHGACMAPCRGFRVKLQPNVDCRVCGAASSGTFLHVFWECPVVIGFWTHVNLVLSSLLQVDWFAGPGLCLLDDDSGLCVGLMRRRMLFVGFVAAGRTVVRSWFAPRLCGEACWIHGLLRVVTCGCATARINGAGPSAVEAWQCFSSNIRDYIKELLFFFLPLSLPCDWTFGIGSIRLLFCCVLFVLNGYCVVMCVKMNKKC